MILVGVYGRMGSGKSEVARLFADHGAAVIGADEIGRDVVDSDPGVLRRLADEFGPEILDGDGQLKRRELGRLAFADDNSRAKLDSIVHPALLERLWQEVDTFAKSDEIQILVVDAALIVKWEIEERFDFLVYVTAPREVQIARIVESGMSRDEAIDRLDRQLPDEIQASKADFIINNQGTLEDLRLSAERVFTQISGLEKTD